MGGAKLKRLSHTRGGSVVHESDGKHNMWTNLKMGVAPTGFPAFGRVCQKHIREPARVWQRDTVLVLAFVVLL